MHCSRRLPCGTAGCGYGIGRVLKGPVATPAEFRNRDGIESGEDLDIDRHGAGVYSLTAWELPKDHTW